MKKTILLFVFGITFFTSCTTSDDYKSLKNEKNNIYPEIKMISGNQINNNDNIYSAEYKNSIIKTEKEENNIYSIKINNNEQASLKVQLIENKIENGTEFYYLRSDNSKLAKAKILLNENILEVEILEYYPTLSLRGGWWDETVECFEDTMSSAHGIIGGVVSSFVGPIGSATYVGAIGLACALQD